MNQNSTEVNPKLIDNLTFKIILIKQPGKRIMQSLISSLCRYVVFPQLMASHLSSDDQFVGVIKLMRETIYFCNFIHVSDNGGTKENL